MGTKFFVTIIFVGALIAFFIFFRATDYSGENIKQKNSAEKTTPKKSTAGEITTSIFVPYWSMEEDNINLSDYSRSIYFGVAVSEDGVDKNEQGFLKLSRYSEVAVSGENLLTVRMTNFDVNQKVLADKIAQSKIIDDSINIARDNNFSGIVLDLEVFSLFNDKMPILINNFVSDFSRASKRNNLYFAVAIYGDVFYRHRPYDLKSISASVDEIMVMTYDFSKIHGEPGPNFPLGGHEKYGYDMKRMLKDFLEVAPVEKLSVIFGMYGYDWTVDTKGRPLKPAQALTNIQIREKYIDNCDKNGCRINEDQPSAETNIIKDNHILWFEDQKSVEKKQKYLESQGIGSFAYWALGYF